jgi:hypothetical protein
METPKAAFLRILYLFIAAEAETNLGKSLRIKAVNLQSQPRHLYNLPSILGVNLQLLFCCHSCLRCVS